MAGARAVAAGAAAAERRLAGPPAAGVAGDHGGRPPHPPQVDRHRGGHPHHPARGSDAAPKGNEQLQRDVEAIGRSVKLAAPAAAAAAPSAGATAADRLVAARRRGEPGDRIAGRQRRRHSDHRNRRVGRPHESRITGTWLPRTCGERWIPSSRSPRRAAGRFVVVGTNGGWANSQDGGRTWSGTTGVNCPAGFTSCNGDPSVAVGRSGNFYAAIIGWPTGVNRQDPAGTSSNVVLRSTNNGQSFTFVNNSVICNNGGAASCFPDQEHITADRVIPGTGGGDQVYSTWRNFDATDQDPAIVCCRTAAPTGRPRSTSGAASSRGSASAATGSPTSSTGTATTSCSTNASPCSAGPDAAGGFPVTVTAVSDVTCPVAGLTAATMGTVSRAIWSRWTMPTRHMFSWPTPPTPRSRQRVRARPGVDRRARHVCRRQGRSSERIGERPPLHAVGLRGRQHGLRHLVRPAVCHSRCSDLFTDFFGGSASLDMSDTLLAGPEFRHQHGVGSQLRQRLGAVRRARRETPRAARSSRSSRAYASTGQAARAPNSDATSRPARPARRARAACLAEAVRRTATTTATRAPEAGCSWPGRRPRPPTGVPPGAGIDTFTDSRVVCCVPQIQTAGSAELRARRAAPSP